MRAARMSSQPEAFFFLWEDIKNLPKKYATGGIWLPNLNIWRWKFSHDFFFQELPTAQDTHSEGSRGSGWRSRIMKGLEHKDGRQGVKKIRIFYLISMRKRFLARTAKGERTKEDEKGCLNLCTTRSRIGRSKGWGLRAREIPSRDSIASHLHTWSEKRVRHQAGQGQTSFFIYPP